MDGRLDVEVHEGKVVGVWFHCQFLPFQQWEVGAARAAELGDGGPDDVIIADRIVLEERE
jgi:hypothetical protein